MSTSTIRPAFRSAFPLGGGPVTPDQILAFHRLHFGSAQMNGADGAAQGGDNGGGDPVNFKDPETGEEFAFPDKTPLASMTEPQKTEYWRHKAQKHEKSAKARADYDDVKAERDRLKAAGQTDAEKAAEKAVTEARADERARVEAETRDKYASQLVGAEFKAALAGKRDPKDIASLIEGLDITKFLTATGEVDTDKVTNYAAGLAPSGTSWPDTGAGRRGGSRAKPGDAGAAEADRRFGSPNAKK